MCPSNTKETFVCIVITIVLLRNQTNDVKCHTCRMIYM